MLARLAAAALDGARHCAGRTNRVHQTAPWHEAAARLRHALEVAEVLEGAVRALGLLAGADRCLIRLMTDGKLGPISHQWVAPGVEPLIATDSPAPDVSVRAARTGTTQWIEDPSEEGPDAPTGLPARGLLAAPLRWGDEVLGVISLHSLQPRAWSASEIELIEDAAREVSIAVHHGSLYAEARAPARRLAELDRLRGDFIAMVSHELRSPMAVIVGIADIMQKRIDELKKEQRDELLATLSREARRLARLVSEILDVEALDRGGLKLRLAEVDLVELVREAVADSGVAERIALTTPPAPAPVHADADRIKQVLVNLISNAAKFDPDQGAIDIDLGSGGGGWVTSVRDRGPGIPPEERGRVFQRFARLDSTWARPGSGLGLYLARALVEAHGGEIWVEDPADGPGAVVCFRLPAAGAA
jgi:signal transduction histidine kinase